MRGALEKAARGENKLSCENRLWTKLVEDRFLYTACVKYQPIQNQIRFIPEDLFTDMPKLKSLDISINQISVLPEQTFKPVFTSLDRLIVIGLPFTCDCRLSWIKPQWKERKSLMLVEWHESSRAENLPILLGDGFQTSRLKI
ncbi:uncharacterized protein LOC143254145 isoform X1 [Tachypleus tridentatus]|uniref:uncharacterized protein LOC143254145 isoform X1 n=1 Tax=Tachypleus tridentatus TaxID=6853 RepID=UPI003FD47587